VRTQRSKESPKTKGGPSVREHGFYTEKNQVRSHVTLSKKLAAVGLKV
jgi:hypothetical protein